MNDSLSVLLLVRNAQQHLATDVAEMLDVASDLTDRIELLILDDGSTDHTEEVAWDLVQMYQQVEMLRHPLPSGLRQAIRSGLARTRGEFLMIANGSQMAPASAMYQLWEARHRGQIIEAGTARGQADIEALGPAFLMRRPSAAELIEQIPNRAIPQGDRDANFRFDAREAASIPAWHHAMRAVRDFALGE